MVSYLFMVKYLSYSKELTSSIKTPILLSLSGFFVPFVIFIHMTKSEQKKKNKIKMGKATRKMNQKKGIHNKKS